MLRALFSMCCAEDVPIFTSHLLTFFAIPDVKIGKCSVGYARWHSEHFSLEIRRTRINNYLSKGAFPREAVVMRNSA